VHKGKGRNGSEIKSEKDEATNRHRVEGGGFEETREIE